MTIHDITAEQQDSVAATHQAVREGTIFIPLRYHRKRDGTIFPVEIVGGPYVWQGRRVMFALAHDITVRKRAEEALRESEARFREVLENSLDASYKRNLITNAYDYLSPVFTRISGYTPEEMNSLPIETVLGLIHPDDLADVKHVVAGATSGAAGTAYHVQYRFKHKAGSYCWLQDQFTVMRDADGQPLALIGSVSDITGRKQAEMALRESEIRWKNIFEDAPIGMFESTPEGKFIYVNPTLVSILGYESPAELIEAVNQASIPEVIYENPARHPLLLNQLEQVGGNWKIFENRYRRKDKGIIDATLAISEIIDPLTHIRYLYGFIQDITERKHAEEALRESEERFRSLLHDVQSVSVQGYGPDGATQYWNQASERLYGYRAQEAIGRNLLDLIIPPEMREDVKQAIRQMAETGQPIPASELSLMRKDGSRVDVFSSHAIVQIPGRTQELFCIDIDLTERKQVEAALLENQSRLADIITFLPDATLAIDKEKRIILWNKAIEEMTGISAAEMIGKGDYAYTVPFYGEVRPQLMDFIFEDYGEIAVKYPTIIREGESLMSEVFCNALYNNKGAWVFAKASPLHDQSGNIIGAIESIRDITERKRVEMELLQEKALLAQKVEERTADLRLANSELLRSARIKDEFLASMSHELRTPLTGILGLSEALQANIYGELNQKQIDSIENIEKSGKHLLTLINDILDLSKIGAGMIKLEFSSVSIPSVCHSSIQMIRQVSHEKQIKVNLNIEPGVEYLEADERRLKQILVNLLGNAVKFSSEGGTIGLDVKGDKDNQRILFTVWDRGIGISPQDLSNLFQPFTQLDGALSRQYGGTGLGLSLVLKMAELHGGGVSVKSEPGRGSRFIVTLPWQGNHHLETNEIMPQTISLTEPKTNIINPLVLIVEDNPLYLNLLTDILIHSGYQVVTAQNGEEGIIQAREKRPHLILMDIQMPVLDGFQATRRIRADSILEKVPIIALTALAMSGDREKCFEAGMNGYLSKPVNIEELKKAIETLIYQDTDLDGKGRCPD